MDWLHEFRDYSFARAVRFQAANVKRHGGGMKGLAKTRKEWATAPIVWRELEKRIKQGKL